MQRQNCRQPKANHGQGHLWLAEQMESRKAGQQASAACTAAPVVLIKSASSAFAACASSSFFNSKTSCLLQRRIASRCRSRMRRAQKRRPDLATGLAAWFLAVWAPAGNEAGRRPGRQRPALSSARSARCRQSRSGWLPPAHSQTAAHWPLSAPARRRFSGAHTSRPWPG